MNGTNRQLDDLVGKRPLTKVTKGALIVIEPLDNGFVAVVVDGYVVRACRTHDEAFDLAKALVTKPVSGTPRVY